MVGESTWPAHFTVLAAERGHSDVTSGSGCGSPDISCRSWTGTGALGNRAIPVRTVWGSGRKRSLQGVLLSEEGGPEDEDDRRLLYACPPWGRALCWGPAVEGSEAQCPCEYGGTGGTSHVNQERVSLIQDIDLSLGVGSMNTCHTSE